LFFSAPENLLKKKKNTALEKNFNLSWYKLLAALRAMELPCFGKNTQFDGNILMNKS
jgi:hypothetical protein